jgi:RNA polymerase sigma factor (sigma-70 family)
MKSGPEGTDPEGTEPEGESNEALVARLYGQHGPVLEGFLKRRIRSSQDAADLAQEVYLRMLNADTSTIRNPEAYLFTVASNLAQEHNRLQGRTLGAFDVDDPVVQGEMADVPDFASEIDTENRTRRLQEVLGQLSPKCRSAVVLQYWQGKSYQEIAQVLKVSTNMVKKYLSQAHAHCRRRMARME